MLLVASYTFTIVLAIIHAGYFHTVKEKMLNLKYQ